jgi:hypothetical protein
VIIPGQPFTGILENLGGVLLKNLKVFKGIDSVQGTGVDQAHKQIPDIGPVLRLIKQRIFRNTAKVTLSP